MTPGNPAGAFFVAATLKTYPPRPVPGALGTTGGCTGSRHVAETDCVAGHIGLEVRRETGKE